MGKIALIVGPHGVGKTTLFSFAKTKDDFLVFDGIQLPTNGYNLQMKDDFLAYEALYLKSINKNNNTIKKSKRHGLVVRSVEEASYYFYFHADTNLMKEYKKIFDDKSNIKADCIIFLDADYMTLQHRCNNDEVRDMAETNLWYEHEYNRYVNYWKHYPGVITIDTIEKNTETVYRELKEIILSL